jgi:hypothetical protein
VLALADLAPRFAGLAIIQPDLTISTHTGQSRAVGTEFHAVDIVRVLFANAGVEFKWRAVVEDQPLVVAGGRGAQWPLLSDRDGIDLLRVAVDFSDGVAAVPADAVAVSLLAVTDGDDALRVAVPG